MGRLGLISHGVEAVINGTAATQLFGHIGQHENLAPSSADENVSEDGLLIDRHIAVQRMLAEKDSGIGVVTIIAIVGGLIVFLAIAFLVSACID